MDPEVVDTQLRRYLEHNGLLEPNQLTCWKIEKSKLSGRGVLAQRAIARDELVYVDVALVLGPRCYSKYLPMCVGCYRRGCALFPCERGCGLPVCSDGCQEDPEHRDRECAYLRALQPERAERAWSQELLQALVPVRALLLPSWLKDIIYSLQCHQYVAREVDMLKKNVKVPLKPDEEEFMRRVCNVMDTNAFETAVVRGSESICSLRALFPLGALTNHQCVPNTRHLVDETGRLFVYAAKDIGEGDEITMSYTDLLWDTTMRRQFLRATKHFSCQCSRCADPTESNSLLGALSCANSDCLGNLLPDAPLNFNSSWTCNGCNLRIKHKQILCIRSGILAIIQEMLYETPRKMLKFIKRELSVVVPKTNHFMIDMIFRIISLFGRVDGLTWEDLTEEELSLKIMYCKNLLRVLDQLNCGDCIKKGLLLYELYCTNNEKMKRVSSEGDKSPIVLQNELETSLNEQILLEAMRILKDDIAAPNDYREIYATRS